MRLIPLIVLITAPSFAICEIIDDDAKLSDFNSINVIIHDDASNGCWTNTSETKSYALGQLELVGAKVDRSNNDMVFETSGGATLNISVIGQRQLESACFGHITIRLEQISSSQNNRWSIRFYSTINSTLAHFKNFNTLVLDEVKRAIKEWD